MVDGVQQLEPHWPAIEAVAKTLLRKHLLDGQQVHDTVLKQLDPVTRQRVEGPLGDGWG